MKTLNISLRALSSPLSLLSIGLLLLNDHVLKAIYPSAFTGKMSDFAGLFFFPILLTALLSIPLESVKLRTKLIAFIAYAFTFVGFALIKTNPQINAATTGFLSQLLGYPTNIVLDPTDLIALLSLWPSWNLLQGIPVESKFIPRRAYPVAALAILATMATSPAITPEVKQIVAFENQVFAYGQYLIFDPETSFAVSDDYGYTWQGITEEDVPPEVINYFKELIELPKTVCLSSNEAHCYRVNGETQVLRTEDGGQTWSVAWEIPSERHILIERLRFQGLRGLIPLDITLASKDQSHYIVVAMGEQGVLVRNTSNEWQRIAVEESSPEPIPLYVNNLNSSFRATQLEVSVLLLASNLTLLTLTAIFATRIMTKDRHFYEEPQDQQEVRRVLYLFNTLPLLIYSILALMFTFRILSNGSVDEVMALHLFLMLVFGLGLAWTWDSLIDKTSLIEEAKKIRTISIAIAILSPIIAIVPFILWTFGTIFDYKDALIISIVLFVAILILGFRFANRVTNNLPEEPNRNS